MEKGVRGSVDCPRCHSPGMVRVENRGDRRYIYIWHYIGNRRYRRCYIGPLEGYAHTANIYGIMIHHAFSIDHKLDLIDQLVDDIVERIEEGEASGVDRGKIERIVGKLVRVLKM